MILELSPTLAMEFIIALRIELNSELTFNLLYEINIIQKIDGKRIGSNNENLANPNEVKDKGS